MRELTVLYLACFIYLARKVFLKMMTVASNISFQGILESDVCDDGKFEIFLVL